MKDGYAWLAAVVVGLLIGFATSEYRTTKLENAALKDRVSQVEKSLGECRASCRHGIGSIGAPAE